MPDYLTPKQGTIFPTLGAATKFYTRYAHEAGFSIKFGTKGVYANARLRKKELQCNRHGSPRNLGQPISDETDGVKQRRHSSHFVTGCKAMVTIHRYGDSENFIVEKLVEAHNHELNKRDEIIFSPQYRRLQIFDKMFIFKASTLNIGATKAHKLKASMVGGYSKLRPSKVDYKNFWRDYTTIVGPTDAQCIVDTLTERRDKDSDFFFQIPPTW